MKFVVYKDHADEWRWRFLANNNRIIADSGEGYKRKAEAKRAVKRVIKGIHSIPMDIEVLEMEVIHVPSNRRKPGPAVARLLQSAEHLVSDKTSE